MTAINSVGNALTSSTGSGAFVGATSPTITTPVIAQINDVNGVAELAFSATSTAVNNFQITNNITGSNPILSSIGADADIGINFLAKGGGTFLLKTTASDTAVRFNTGTGYQHLTYFTFANTAATRTVTWPDADGTVAFTSGASGIVNSGTINQLAYYASSGTTVSGLATAASGVLVTSAGSVPSISSTLPAGLTIPTPKIAQINDTNGNAMLAFSTTSSSVNYLQINNNSTGLYPDMAAVGSDSNIGINFTAKGTAPIGFQSALTTNQIIFNIGTSLVHTANFSFPVTSGSTTYTWPDASGTVALTSGASGIVNSGLINQLGYYASAGTTISGLSIVNNAGLLTNGSGLPGWVAYTGSGAPVLGTSPTITTPKIAQINDVNGNEILALTPLASAVNYFTITNQATGVPPGLFASGSDTNISVNIYPKGTGALQLISQALTSPLVIENGTSAQHITVFSFANTLATQTVTFPDATGTLLMTGQAISTVPSIAFSSTSGVIGTTTNDNAAAGSVGEFVSSVITTGGIVNITASGTAQNLTSISLTAGDWDVWGNMFFQSQGLATGVTNYLGWTSQASASAPDASQLFELSGAALETAGNQNFCVPYARYSLSGTTTIYLSGTSTFSTGNPKFCGAIYARRAR